MKKQLIAGIIIVMVSFVLGIPAGVDTGKTQNIYESSLNEEVKSGIHAVPLVFNGGVSDNEIKAGGKLKNLSFAGEDITQEEDRSAMDQMQTKMTKGVQLLRSVLKTILSKGIYILMFIIAWEYIVREK